jgi:ABC-type polar amino acid transport system ATPase subunit
MKRNRRRLPIVQYEFGFAVQAFNLFQQMTLDGELLAREHAEAEQSRQRAEAAQAKLFAKSRPKRLFRRAA